MTTANHTGFRTFQATAVAISAFVRVQVDSNGLISVAGATDNWIGWTQEPIPASGYGTVKLRNAAGTQLATASAAITRGARIYPTAAGKIDDAAGTGVLTGFVALEAATADGDIIEVGPCDQLVFTASATQAALTAYADGSHGLAVGADMSALQAQLEGIKTALVSAGIIKGAA